MLGSDLPFSAMSLKLKHNADLNDKLGNLVHRAIKLCGGVVPKISPEHWKQYGPESKKLPFSVREFEKSFCEAMEDARTGDATDLVMKNCAAANQWIAEIEPWKMNKTKPEEAKAVIRLLLESIYILAHFFAPFIPQAATV